MAWARPTSIPSGILIHRTVWPQYGLKSGDAVPLFGYGELGPHLKQCPLGRGLRLYQVASCPSSRLDTADIGQKLGLCPMEMGAASPSGTIVARAEAYLRAKFHLDPSNRLATVHQCYRHTGQTDRQRSGSIGRTVFINGRPKINGF